MSKWSYYSQSMMKFVECISFYTVKCKHMQYIKKHFLFNAFFKSACFCFVVQGVIAFLRKSNLLQKLVAILLILLVWEQNPLILKSQNTPICWRIMSFNSIPLTMND